VTQIFGGMPPLSRRSNSQSGSYFDQAVEALRSSGDPDVLWAEASDFHRGSLIFEQPQRRVDALQRRLWLLRSTVLFTAVCAEAYANEFIAELLSSSDAKAVDRMSTVDKILLSPRLGGKESSVARGSEPLQTIQALFKVRDALVHPRKTSPAAYVRYATDQDEALVGPHPAGRYLIAVATLMETLDPLRPPPPVFFRPGSYWRSIRRYWRSIWKRSAGRSVTFRRRLPPDRSGCRCSRLVLRRQPPGVSPNACGHAGTILALVLQPSAHLVGRGVRYAG
jgi:hypothetical protein